MTVDTAKVQGRRSLSFASLDEVVAEAERLVAARDVEMLGNLSLGQILAHLAIPINGAIDGVEAKGPWVIRTFLGPWIKARIARKGMSPGFQLPRKFVKDFFPENVSAEQGLERLRKAVERQKSERMTSDHPMMGPMSHEEWERLHRRHAELHLSFAVPRD